MILFPPIRWECGIVASLLIALVSPYILTTTHQKIQWAATLPPDIRETTPIRKHDYMDLLEEVEKTIETINPFALFGLGKVSMIEEIPSSHGGQHYSWQPNKNR